MRSLSYLAGVLVPIFFLSALTGCPADRSPASSRAASSSTVLEVPAPSASAQSDSSSPAPTSNAAAPSQTASSKASAKQAEPGVIPNDASGIPDKALYRAILQTIGEDGKAPVDKNRDGKLQFTEAQSLPYAVNWDGNGIASLQGIETLSAYEFHLNNNQIRDLSPLVRRARKVKAGEDLITAELKNNRISDLSPLAKMRLSNQSGLQFDHLDLSGNRISNVTPLNLLQSSGIRVLNLSHNQIQNADALLGHVMVEVLDLSYNRISAIGKCSPDVFYLDLSHNQLKTVGSLSDKFLTQLDLADNRLTDLSFVRGAQADGTSGVGLLCLNASNNQLSALPDFKSWGWTNFSPEKEEDGTYRVDFRGNRLTESEFRAKLPEAFLKVNRKEGDAVLNGAQWLTDQVKGQKP